jgi:polysaccharide deacetylase family protein (PEP-CTERM system associated)
LGIRADCARRKTGELMTESASSVLNALTVDVEEHYQVSAFEPFVNRSDWDAHPSRVEDNTRRLMDLFDRHHVKGTFFVLGWLAERNPALVKEIAAAGHEIAAHGYSHRLVYEQTKEEFRQETQRVKHLLEDISGRLVRGYRAASFSITKESLWALDILGSLGYDYDSSVFPVRHDRYGIASAPRLPYRIRLAERSLLEFPPSTLELGPLRLPVCGGGYLRLYPLRFSRHAIQRLNADRASAVVYVHPWEVDPDQPRVKAPMAKSFRHYVGLNSMSRKLDLLLQAFRFAPMADILDRNEPQDEVKTDSWL